MQVESIVWKSSQPIAEQYIRDFERVHGLFEYDPNAHDVWKQRASWLDEGNSPRADRDRLADALRLYNETIGNDTAALRNVNALRNKEALAVVGGQQAGLLSGTLLVIYKAVTLIQTARQASEELGRHIVPVFWIAGEDHDWDEVNHIYSLTSQNEIERIRLAKESDVRTSVSRTPVSQEEWNTILNQLDDSLADSEFKGEWMNTLRDYAGSSRTLTDFFARMLARLFGRYGLVLMDSDDPDIRRVETGLFERLIVQNESLGQAFLEGQSHVRKLGFPVQAEAGEQAANLFMFERDERLLLIREGELFTSRKAAFRYTKEQLLERLKQSPESFSNNVMTRPLMQEYLFPVLGTVLGPGEIAYWALLRHGFSTLGMKMPVIIPRIEVTLLESAVQKHMRKYELTIEDVIEQFEERRNNWLKEQDTLQLEDRFEEAKQRFRDLYKPIVELVSELNPVMKKLSETNVQKITEQMDFLLTKALIAQKTQHETALRQLERIRLSILPFGKPQERVYNVIAYLNRYGEQWLRELTETPMPLDGRHKLYYF